MSARLRATPWFREPDAEEAARESRRRRVMFPPPVPWTWLGLDTRPSPVLRSNIYAAPPVLTEELLIRAAAGWFPRKKDS